MTTAHIPADLQQAEPRLRTHLAHSASVVAWLSLAFLTLLGLPGCRGERTDQPPRQFIPDMDDSPKFKPQTATGFFEDGRAMRPAVPYTVAFGPSMDPEDPDRVWTNNDDPSVFEGVDNAKSPSADGRPAYQVKMPEEVLDKWIATAAARGKQLTRDQAFTDMVLRGQERFNIYCSACHGYQGEGGGRNPDDSGYGGLVGQRWGYTVPSFHDAKYADRTVYTGQDGYLFHTIRNGVPDTDPAKPHKMPGYADKVKHADAWAIVQYLRVLQASRTGDFKGIPADARERLERSRPTVPGISDGGGRSRSGATTTEPSVAATSEDLP